MRRAPCCERDGAEGGPAAGNASSSHIIRESRSVASDSKEVAAADDDALDGAGWDSEMENGKEIGSGSDNRSAGAGKGSSSHTIRESRSAASDSEEVAAADDDALAAEGWESEMENGSDNRWAPGRFGCC